MTYRQIINKYKELYNYSIKTCWIADAKRRMGYPVRVAANRINTKNVQHPCPNDEIFQNICGIINNI